MSINLEHNEEHREQARDMVIEQFKRSQKFNDWLGVYIDQVQGLEDALWQLYTERGVDTAEGAQLDVLGVIVGQDRLGLEDEDYRTRIKVRIRLNRASGIADDIYDVFGLMLGNQIGAVDLQEVYPAGLIVQMNEYVDTSASVLAAILKEARGAGIDTSLVWLPSEDGIFECSSDAAPVTGSLDEGFAGLSPTVASFAFATGYFGGCYAEGLYLIAGVSGASRIQTSVSGTSFTTAYTASAGQVNDVVYSPTLSMFAACGQDRAHWSLDGLAWTGVVAASRNWTQILWADHLAKFVAFNQSNPYALMSSDGLIWTDTALTGATGVNTPAGIKGIAYSPTLQRFISVYSGSTLKSSTDGVAWTDHGAFAYNDGVVWSDVLGAFVACDSGAGIAYSLDGITGWTSLMGATAVATLYAVATTYGVVVVTIAGGVSTDAYLVTSDFNLITFALSSTTSGRPVDGANGTIVTVTSGTAASIITGSIYEGGELAGVLQA